MAWKMRLERRVRGVVVLEVPASTASAAAAREAYILARA